jgi:putative transposase
MEAVRQLAVVASLVVACRVLGVSRASWYRWRRPRPALPRRPCPARALAPAERQQVLDLLHNPRFVDQSPAEVYATLLDEGSYVCSLRSLYRLLASAQEVRERRNLLRHPHYQPPQLLATAPNQVWSWDITKLLGPVKWVYFYLYVMLDLFSRYVVGWLLAERESGALGQQLIEESCRKQQIEPGQLTIHSDRGPAMKSSWLLLARLGVRPSHSRPHVSNDNPFSEAQFKTLKYRPEFPDRFGSFEHALSFCRAFFPWYNHEHHHSALGWLTPAVVHYGQAPQLLEQRQRVLTAAYQAHPERFVRGRPTPPGLPPAVWINPPRAKTTRPEGLGATIVTPGDLGYPPVFNSSGLCPDLPVQAAREALLH